MNLVNGDNTIIVTGRPLAEAYTVRFTSILAGTIVYCDAANTGSEHGPLLLTFTVATNSGDHLMEVLSDTDVVWSEQVRVD